MTKTQKSLHKHLRIIGRSHVRVTTQLVRFQKEAGKALHALDESIASAYRHLKDADTETGTAKEASRVAIKKRQVSAAGIARIQEAQRRRWARVAREKKAKLRAMKERGQKTGRRVSAISRRPRANKAEQAA